MTFRSSRYCKRYEYTSVELQNPIQMPANNQAKKKAVIDSFLIVLLKAIHLTYITVTYQLILKSLRWTIQGMLPAIR